ncbi:Gfo/Idh/MocA family oxidoreductase [Nocardioides anomalus]|uniref:Gfo/Idh/MocA family oxidoreductase n=1 Tax=Nocardioides anomalus TaxID=2712223 RepID=A0A6G6WDB9_9ACTN|nr:Gfo/Idh/MocA family oxidoreductase [Nocardioides anomalus]QIG43341.1 Gfo/Idh/MocA family oxidoreductase [Nocardioides anomalus]
MGVTSTGDDARPLGVAMIGYAFMGAAHSQAWRNAHRFFDLPLRPAMNVVCGRAESATRDAAEKLGWAGWTTDWRDVLERDDVQVVDICTPGDSHAEIAVAALEAGKHVLCEKPLANTVAEAEQMTQVAEEAEGRGVLSMVGFNYRRTPALAYARQLVERGVVGELRHVRAQYLQDWIVDPEFPLVWRLQKDKAGSGALGDIGAHIVDLSQFLTGQRLTEVAGHLTRFVERRPLPEAASGLSASGGTELGEVSVDDAAVFSGRTDGGALATYEATRFATGRKNAMRIELNGSAGSIAFDFEAMNELHVHDATAPAADAGFRRILVTEAEHPYAAAWWPPGHGLGYEHTFVHEIADFVRDVAAGTAPTPSFADGLQVQRVLDAVERSSDAGAAWTKV